MPGTNVPLNGRNSARISVCRSSGSSRQRRTQGRCRGARFGSATIRSDSAASKSGDQAKSTKPMGRGDGKVKVTATDPHFR